MGSRDSWIDQEEVSDLLGSIFPGAKVTQVEKEIYQPLPLLEEDEIAGARESLSESRDRSDSEADGTVRGDATAAKISERLRLIRRRAERSGLLVGSVAEKGGAGAGDPGVAPEPFVLPGGGLAEQVRALVAWLSVGSDEVFILDENGDELLAGEVPPGIRRGAVRLALSWEVSQRWLAEDGLAAGVPLAGASLAGGRILSVVGERYSGRFYCAALIGPQLLSPAHAVRVREALQLVFA